MKRMVSVLTALIVAVLACSSEGELAAIQTETPRPTPTTDNKLTPEEEEYVESVMSILEDMSYYSGEVSDVFGRAKEDTSLYYSDIWLDELEFYLNGLIDASGRARKLESPESFEEGHDLLLDVTDNFEKGSELLLEGFEETDINTLREAADYIRQAIDGLRDVSDWYEDNGKGRLR